MTVSAAVSAFALVGMVSLPSAAAQPTHAHATSVTHPAPTMISAAIPAATEARPTAESVDSAQSWWRAREALAAADTASALQQARLDAHEQRKAEAWDLAEREFQAQIDAWNTAEAAAEAAARAEAAAEAQAAADAAAQARAAEQTRAAEQAKADAERAASSTPTAEDGDSGETSSSASGASERADETATADEDSAVNEEASHEAASSKKDDDPVKGEAPIANSAPNYDAAFLDLINKARKSAGLSAVTMDSGLSSVSQGWVTYMVADVTDGRYHHNPSYGEQTQANYPGARTAGENIAKFSTVHSAQAVFDAYMASPGHKANILGPRYDAVGLATVCVPADSSFANAGRCYNAMNFAGKK